MIIFLNLQKKEDISNNQNEDMKNFLGQLMKEQMTDLENKLELSIKSQIQTASVNPMMDLQTVMRLMLK